MVKWEGVIEKGLMRADLQHAPKGDPKIPFQERKYNLLWRNNAFLETQKKPVASLS